MGQAFSNHSLARQYMTHLCHKISSVAIASAVGVFGGLGGLVSR